MKATGLLASAGVSCSLLAFTLGAVAACDSRARVSTLTAPSLPLQPEPARTPTGLSGTWHYRQELLRQTEPVVCGRVMSDTRQAYEGTIQVRQTGSSVDIGCADDFFPCNRGRLDGDTIFADGHDASITNPWCERYPLFHSIQWTIEAVVENESVIRGTMTGRFSYVGGGQVIEAYRAWTLVLNR